MLVGVDADGCELPAVFPYGDGVSFERDAADGECLRTLGCRTGFSAFLDELT
ncbi:hypothetical protein [Bifidobacterium aquikefiri]|uniref:hypothetical protein n=1 Tax=Bifidobacterium aquikefiri TaxID=1653207 RepID=UPI0039EC4224